MCIQDYLLSEIKYVIKNNFYSNSMHCCQLLRNKSSYWLFLKLLHDIIKYTNLPIWSFYFDKKKGPKGF